MYSLRYHYVILHVCLKGICHTSDSWGISVRFISIMLLPIVGNVAEFAKAIRFAINNELDQTLGVALGSATQIALCVVPLHVVIAWIMGISLDLKFNLFETVSLALAIMATFFTLQDGTSHHMKGLILLLGYMLIGAWLFVSQKLPGPVNVVNVGPPANVVNLGPQSVPVAVFKS